MQKSILNAFRVATLLHDPKETHFNTKNTRKCAYFDATCLQLGPRITSSWSFMRASNRSCSQDLPHMPSRRPGKTGKNPRTTSNYPKRSKMKPQAGPKRTSKAFCNVLKALKPTKQNTSVDQVGGMRRQPMKFVEKVYG